MLSLIRRMRLVPAGDPESRTEFALIAAALAIAGLATLFALLGQAGDVKPALAIETTAAVAT